MDLMPALLHQKSKLEGFSNQKPEDDVLNTIWCEMLNIWKQCTVDTYINNHFNLHTWECYITFLIKFSQFIQDKNYK